ncbi:MAG TPA: DUF1003 domain-containing protein [Anaeromyxobacteraceae bacterium]|nr:DUF1003 domain-containing protein [Anaeromyxobacteraceae bacterium]
MPRQPEPPRPSLAPVLDRNIAALVNRRYREEREKPVQDRLADRVTQFTGSLRFVYIHIALFGTWILWNLPFSPLPRFDPTLVVLAMVASVEAIFLSTFVLITQNRMAAQAERRAELDLQISLLTEHELTQLIRVVNAVAAHVGVEPGAVAGDIEAIEQDVHPEAVLDRIQTAEEEQGDREPRRGPSPEPH